LNAVTVVPQTRSESVHRIQNAKKPFCATSECIYVTNPARDTTTLDTITVYPASADGDVAPVQQIAGTNTELDGPWGIAVDKKDNIYAANNCKGCDAPSITVYPVGSNGDMKPSRTIEGPTTTLALCAPTGIAVASNNQLYVDDAPGQSTCYALRVFAAGANGNVAPIRTIVGNNTKLSSPVAVALYGKDAFVINQGNVNPVALLGFKAKSNGNQPPVSNVSGNNAFPAASYADGVAVSSASTNEGIAYVASHDYFIKQWGCPDDTSDGSGGQILGFPYGANGNVAPSVNISGSSTGFVSPCSDAVDKEGRIYVTDSEANAIFVFAPTANGNVAPIQVIQGPDTELDAPEGITVH
jgi:hypothetical protein